MRCDSAASSASAASLLRDRRAERGVLGLHRARGRRRRARCLLRGELVELRLLVGGRGARRVGVLLLLRDRVTLRVELRLEPGDAARVVLALVVDTRCR